MFVVLRNRKFALLCIGQFISLIGDYTLSVALAFYVLQLTHSVLQTGLMFIIETIPSIVFGSLVGVFVDRWDRRKTMIVSNLIQAVVLLVLLFVRSSSLIWLVYLVALTQSLASLFFGPAVRAFTPTLVEEQQLVNANSLESCYDSVTRFIGPPLGGALLTFAGLSSVVFVDSGSFLFSILTLLLIVVTPLQVKDHGEHTELSLAKREKNIWREWLEGLQVVRKSRVLAGLFVVAGVTFAGQGFVSVMFIVFVSRVLHGNGVVFGLMPTAQGAGALLGSFLVARAYKVIHPAYLMAFCLGTIGAATLVFVQIPLLPLVLLLVALIGVCVVGSVVTKQTLVQLHTVDAYRGRVFAALGTMDSLTLLVGMFIATLMGDRLGPSVLLNWSGILYMLSGLVALVMLRQASMVSEHPH